MEVGGASSLHLAARDGHLAVVQHLVHTGKLVNTPGGKQLLTPLHRAAERGHLSVVLYLLQVTLFEPVLLYDPLTLVPAFIYGPPLSCAYMPLLESCAHICTPINAYITLNTPSLRNHQHGAEPLTDDALKAAEPHVRPLFSLLSNRDPKPAMADYNRLVWEDVIKRGLTDANKREHTCWDLKEGELIANSAIYDALSGYMLNHEDSRIAFENDEFYKIFGHHSSILESLRTLARKHSKTPPSTERVGTERSEAVLATNSKANESKTALQLAKDREKAVADSKRILYWVAIHGFDEVRHTLSTHTINKHKLSINTHTIHTQTRPTHLSYYPLLPSR